MNLSIILPNKAKKYLQSLGLKSKNDKIDAQGLSQMCAEKCLDLWQPLSETSYKLRGLTRLYEALQTQRTELSNQLHAQGLGMYKNKDVEASLKRHLKSVDKELKTIADQIANRVNNDELLRNKYEKISKIKGVSMLTFAVIAAETNGFALFRNKRQLVSYVGYDVVENQSGKSVGKTRISKKGNSHIRRALYMPSLHAVKYEATFKAFYERIEERTQIKMKGYVAVQKKLLCFIYALWKKDEAYDPHYVHRPPKPAACSAPENRADAPTAKAVKEEREHASAHAASSLSVGQK